MRFAPGAAGKFLASLLQISTDVNAWHEDLDRCKNVSRDAVLNYFQDRFRADWDQWLLNEPQVPYQNTFCSNKFPRGDDVSWDQALDLLAKDTVFQSHLSNDRRIVLILNKSRIPDWIKDRCEIINILIDDLWALKWLHRARYLKMFKQTEPGVWLLKEHTKKWTTPGREMFIDQYQNPSEFRGTKVSFLRQHVMRDPLTQMFQHLDVIVADPTNQNVAQHVFPLSSLSDADLLVRCVENLYRQIGIEMPQSDVLPAVAEYYVEVHRKIFDEKKY